MPLSAWFFMLNISARNQKARFGVLVVFLFCVWTKGAWSDYKLFGGCKTMVSFRLIILINNADFPYYLTNISIN